MCLANTNNKSWSFADCQSNALLVMMYYNNCIVKESALTPRKTPIATKSSIT